MGRFRFAALLAIGLGATVFAYGVVDASSLPAQTYKASARCYGVVVDTRERVGVHIPGGICGAFEDLSQVLPGRTPAPVPASMPNPAAYPLAVSPSGRYLVDHSGSPFLMIGDSPQALIGNVSQSDAELFFSNRASYGFNTVWINLVCNAYTGCNQDGTTYDGVRPFSTPGDLSTPNEAYFARADAYIRLASTYGINVVLDPIETGGWLPVLRQNGNDRAYQYGLYVGTRYRDMPNIVWMLGNDFQSWRDPADDALVLAVARGIRDADSVHLMTVELDGPLSSSADDPAWSKVVQVDAAYTYVPTYAEVLKEYNRQTIAPVVMIEASYEHEHLYSGPETLRRQEYWTQLSGAAGQLYGNKYTWPLSGGWQTHLDTPGSVQMNYVLNLFGSRRWYALVPDQDHRLVTAGYGSFSDTGDLNQNNFVTAAATDDGSLAIAYVPTQAPITLNLSRFAAPVTVRWYDPSNGTYKSVSDAALPNVGSQDFRAPGPNADGDGDWVLVMETSPAQ